MRFGLLGPLEVIDDDGRMLDLGGAQPRLLLAVLAAAAGRVVHADALVLAVWGDAPPPSAGGTLQSYISRLRRELEPHRPRGAGATRLLFEPPGYRLAVTADELDYLRFEQLAEEGRTALHAGRFDDARRVLLEAEGLWRGAALAEYADHDFARGLAVRLENRRLAAIDDRLAADLALGRHRVVIGEISELVDAHPYEEGLHAHLALALYRSGRQADALQAIDRARRCLRDDLGLELSPPLRELERSILTHSTALDAPGAPGAASPSPEPGVGAATVVAAAAAQAPSPSTAAEGLVGRAAELRVLRALLDEAAGATRVAIIEGEPGIGKTRLAEEIGREAAHRGAMVVWGRTLEGGASPAFWPWLPPLRALANALPPSAPLAPELATLLATRQTTDEAPGAAEAARYVLAERIVGLFALQAAERQIVLVLDDIQWADAASLDLLATLPGRLVDAPLLIVATIRELDVGRNDALVDTLAALTRVPGTRRITLRGLDVADTATLVSRTTGLAPTSTLVDAIHERAEGNPFFTTELARLIAGGTEGADVPASVRDVVRRRLALLPPGCAEVLQVAAIIGRDIDLGLLVAASGRGLDECLDDLEPALLQRLLVPVPESPSTYRFVHALVREVLVSDISALKKARLHLRVADVLVPSDDTAEIVAEHLWEAVPIGVGRRAARALERAGQVALRRFAYQSAENLLARAVQLYRPNNTDPTDLDAELRAIVLHTSVQVAFKGYPTILGDRTLQRGRELAAQLGQDTELLNLMWAEWAGLDLSCQYHEADRVAHELLERSAAVDAALPRVLGHTAVGISQWHRGAIADAAHHLDAARDAAMSIPHDASQWVLFDRDQVRISMAFTVYVHDLMGDTADTEARFDAMIREIPGDRYWELIVCNFAASGALNCGDLDRAERWARRGIAADPDAISAFWSMAVRCYLGATIALQGDLDAGFAIFDPAWERYTGQGMRTNCLAFLSSRAQALINAGHLEQADAVLEDAHRELALYDERYAEPLLRQAEASLAAARGEPARAAALFGEAVSKASTSGSHRIAARVRATAASYGITLPD